VERNYEGVRSMPPIQAAAKAITQRAKYGWGKSKPRMAVRCIFSIARTNSQSSYAGYTCIHSQACQIAWGLASSFRKPFSRT
jgi:hypothetical protein